jgi:transcriptional regulator with GAF, ATPase, and Fis domain
MRFRTGTSLAIPNGMTALHLMIRDPGGHERQLKLTKFPAVIDTLDPKIGPEAFVIERPEGRNPILLCLQPGLLARVSGLNLQAFEIPFGTPIRIGDSELVFENQAPKTLPLSFPDGVQGWHCVSDGGREMLQSVKKSSLTRLSIYLSGETGTGKEVLARLVHAWSDRAGRSFVPINCGALPVSLAESELFGHVKGSFTGAVRDRPGALLQAHGGTLFLDEVGDLPPELQVKLLRFLEDGEIRPVGSERVVHADVRIVCATHKPLKSLVQEGKFRQDLYFRLASIPIRIPPLRDRSEDIRLLAKRFASDQGKSLSAEALTRLQVHPWPGNVRELRHAVERASGLSGPFESVLSVEDFEFLVNDGDSGTALEVGLPGVASLKEMEKWMLLRSLRIANGNRSDAARVLGVARSTLFEMMKRHGIPGPRALEASRYQLMAESS